MDSRGGAATAVWPNAQRGEGGGVGMMPVGGRQSMATSGLPLRIKSAATAYRGGATGERGKRRRSPQMAADQKIETIT